MPAPIAGPPEIPPFPMWKPRFHVPAPYTRRAVPSAPVTTPPPGADFLSRAERSDLMRKVKGQGAEPERLLADALRRRRLSFQTGAPDLPGKPDFLLPRRRLAIFVDGELWHGVQWRRRGLNHLADQFRRAEAADYWVRKIERNRQRDLAATRALLDAGWSLLRFWEADVRRDPAACAQAVADAARSPRTPGPLSSASDLTVCEFFAGMGLMRLGLDAAGWKTIWANDFDPMKRRLYDGLFPDDDAPFDTRDINLIQASDIPTSTLATASFPCVDLSLAGAQRGLSRDTRSGAYLRFIDILRDMEGRRPPLVLLENVTGLLSAGGGRELELCLTLLADLGYRLDMFTLTAAHFTPQSRPRMFIVGVHATAGEHAELAPLDLQPDKDLRPPRLVEFIHSHPDLDWSIRRLPPVPTAPVQLDRIVEPLPDDDPRWWDRQRVAHFRAQISARHRPQVEALCRSDAVSYATAFRRMRAGASTAELRFDGVAGCLRTPKGGSAKQILVEMGRRRLRVRLLTPRECASLMGVENYSPPPDLKPDDALYGFGDAVCVPVITWIARNYLNPLLTDMLRGRPIHPLTTRRPAQRAGDGG